MSPQAFSAMVKNLKATPEKIQEALVVSAQYIQFEGDTRKLWQLITALVETPGMDKAANKVKLAVRTEMGEFLRVKKDGLTFKGDKVSKAARESFDHSKIKNFWEYQTETSDPGGVDIVKSLESLFKRVLDRGTDGQDIMAADLAKWLLNRQVSDKQKEQTQKVSHFADDPAPAHDAQLLAKNAEGKVRPKDEGSTTTLGEATGLTPTTA